MLFAVSSSWSGYHIISRILIAPCLSGPCGCRKGLRGKAVMSTSQVWGVRGQMPTTMASRIPPLTNGGSLLVPALVVQEGFQKDSIGKGPAGKQTDARASIEVGTPNQHSYTKRAGSAVEENGCRGQTQRG